MVAGTEAAKVALALAATETAAPESDAIAVN